MKKIGVFKKVVYCLLIVLPLWTFCQTKKVNVFTSGQGGCNSYRIPALIYLPDGDLLAFCEGRVNGSKDFGNIDIVMKHSSDKGHT